MPYFLPLTTLIQTSIKEEVNCVDFKTKRSHLEKESHRVNV